MAPTGNLPRVNDTTVEEWGRIIALLRRHDAKLGVLDRARMAVGRRRSLPSDDKRLIDNQCTRENLAILLQLGVVSPVTLADFAQSIKLSPGVRGRFDSVLESNDDDWPLPNAIVVSDVLIAHSDSDWSPDTIATLKTWIASDRMWSLYQTGGLSPKLIQQLIDRRLIEMINGQPYFHTPGTPLLTPYEHAMLRTIVARSA